MQMSLSRCLNSGLMLTVVSLGLSGTAFPMQDTKLSLQMKLYVYNYAHVQNPTLSRAQRELTEIFEAMGVITQWRDSSDHENLQADSVYSLMIFILGPSGEAAARSGIALGFSSANHDGGQRPAAYVIYPRIENFVRTHDTANQRSRRLGQVLACAIAHEIGHVLLSTSLHSPTGMMRASWQDDEYKLLVTGKLRFTVAQAKLIRSELARLSR